jgi:2'-5' RNA ligase
MTRAARLRLFVALELPAEVRGPLRGWAREALADAVASPAGDSAGEGRRPRRPPRVVAADSLHLTLCFLGSRPPDELPGLSEAVAAAASGALGELALGAPLWLPPRRPKALAVEVHDTDGSLEELQRAVSDELARVSSWQPERRRFRAHVTVARLRGGERAQPLPPTPRLSFRPEALVLYRSQLHPDGARYEPLAEHALAPG